MSVLVKILRCIFCCYDEDYHDTERDYGARLLGTYNHNSSVRNSSYHNSSVRNSSYHNSSVRNSSFTNHDLLRQHDSNKIYYYEYYPNVSISEPTTKQPNAMSQQTEYGNKSSLKGNNEVSQSLKSSRPSPPSSSCYTCSSSPNKSQSLTQLSSFPNPASASSKPFLSPKGPAPSSSSNSSSSFPKPAIPSSKASSSLSSPASSALSQSLSSLKPHSFNSDQHQLTAKPPESLSPFKSSQSSSGSTSTKNDTAPKVLNKPLLHCTKICIVCYSDDDRHETERDSWERNSLLGTSNHNSSVRNSSHHNSSLRNSSETERDYCDTPSFDSEQHQLRAKPPASPSPRKSSQSLSGYTLTTKDAAPKVLKKPFSQKAPSSSQPTLSPFPSDSTNQQKNDSYLLVKKGASNYKIPKDIEDLVKKDIVPNVLKKPLSPSTYKDYFAALLYAEDFYYEKWSDFQLLNVTLELREATLYDKSLKNKHLKKRDKKDVRFFVAFEIDSVPGERPFLLSRDFVFAQCSGGISRKFEGILYRVVKSTTVLVEFEKEFYSQHQPNRKYDISFSFNRVCLKRAHQSIAAVSDQLFQNCLFPDYACRKHIPSSEPHFYGNWKLDLDGNSAVRQILSLQGQPPYLVEGPLCVTRKKKELPDEDVVEYVLSKTGNVVREAVLQICQGSPNSRILICAPSNRACDVLMESLMKVIPESDMFRANAAFREMDEVTDDIFQVSLVERECFSCPPLEELRQYRVISSTFASSFRLHNKGITAGHFTHIFLVDASSTIEPDALIVLSNLANENTTVIVSGASYDHPRWIRSHIAKKNGLEMSYFKRLCLSKAYRSCDPMFYTRLSTSTE